MNVDMPLSKEPKPNVLQKLTGIYLDYLDLLENVSECRRKVKFNTKHKFRHVISKRLLPIAEQWLQRGQRNYKTVPTSNFSLLGK